MYTIILFAALFVGCFLLGLLCYWLYKMSSIMWDDFFAIFGVVNFGVSAVCFVAEACILISLIGQNAEFEQDKERYYNTKNMIEQCCEFSTDSTQNAVIYENRSKILEINNMISEHKVYSKNKWKNVWYSEEIGNLKPIEYKTKK